MRMRRKPCHNGLAQLGKVVREAGHFGPEHPGVDEQHAGPALHDNGVLIGAICAATLEIARAGLTHGIRHTSNAKAYLKSLVPGYQDGDFYVDELAVSDDNIITASGLGSLEFAREVQRHLKIHNEPEIALWFDMFKNGVVPAGMA